MRNRIIEQEMLIGLAIREFSQSITKALGDYWKFCSDMDAKIVRKKAQSKVSKAYQKKHKKSLDRITVLAESSGPDNKELKQLVKKLLEGAK